MKMSQDNVLLDLSGVSKRYELFRKTFPEECNEGLYEFMQEKSIEINLERLSHAALANRYSLKYLFCYKPIILEIISRWIEDVSCTEKAVEVFDGLSRYLLCYPLVKQLLEEFLCRENKLLIATLEDYLSADTRQLNVVLLAYYRLLNHDKDAFTKFIKVDVLYDIIGKVSSDLVKFLAIKILSLCLDAGEVCMDEMITKNINSPFSILGDYELKPEINYRYLEVNEAKIASDFTLLPEVTDIFTINPNHTYVIIEPKYLSANVVSICGIIVPKIKNQQISPKKEIDLVPTAKSIQTIRDLAKGLQRSEPMMLIGKAGSGKTFLINELSKYMGCEDRLVKIHLGEQTDAKLLIGTYTSGQKSGTFEWRSGVLTTAVREGRWVLIEDVDKAPTEVLSILLTLLERRELSIPSRGETIRAANGFQLLSTIRLNEKSTKNKKHDHFFNILGMRMWKVTELEEPNETDLKEILIQKYPILRNLVPQLIRCYRSVKEIYLDSGFTALNKGAHTRVVSVRDLVKLCSRLQILFTKNQVLKPDQLLESQIYDDMFSEAADCFTGAISESKALNPLVSAIGESLEISNSRVNLYLKKHVPKFENYPNTIEIGRSTLQKERISLLKKSHNSTSFATTNHSLRLMEQISVAVEMSEPTLLVGETGTGKTTVVQQLAKLLHKPLTVINVSQQTETGDLLGGYKPVNSKTIALPVQETFESLFNSTFSLKKNERFHKILHRCFNKGQWKNVVRLWREACKMAESLLETVEREEGSDNLESQKKRRKLDSNEKKVLLEKWFHFKDMIKGFEAQSESIDSSFVFNFVEGSLVKAVRNGEWLLLDEVNLASTDTLESISDLLSEPESRSILLSEKGDAKPIKAHPEFRFFACMNPATDVGKKDLPPGIRSRFTEIYVHSPDADISDLLLIIDKYMRKYTAGDEWIGNDIAELYLEAKKLSDNNLIVDGSNQKPHFSIRTLTRTLLYVCDIVHIYGLRRSLYDGFCMSFLNLLSKKSESILEPVIRNFTIGRLKNVKSVLSQAPPSPGPNYIQFKHYWMRKGLENIKEQAHYIITPFVERNMMNLVRATSGRRFPVLIQGPTSSGKTSMIKYLADITGHKFVRINNHEHTDLQEYLGTYVTDDSGKLSFKEGVLVEALRNGYWIVLDELNLAPTDVLEALNRLLDDNRELFIPETQEVVHPHQDFMLFATQNPPGIYGGRKILSRAFRNRFLELHFDDIPQDELEVILRERCQIAPSYAKKIVESYRQLSIERSATRLFEQKNSFATLRDLFRWAFRDAVGYEELASNGYMLLAERCRNSQEKDTVKKVLEKVMKVKLDMDKFYEELEDKSLMASERSVVWTKTMRRLQVLVSSSLKKNEPVLLVGETGCGKTTICQLLASHMRKQLITLNAHQNTETGDILGAQRPVRNRSQLQKELFDALCDALQLSPHKARGRSLDDLLKEYDEVCISGTAASHKIIKDLRENLKTLFEWVDGPLVKALKDGDFFLFDEISLADDSVLERLNSVLEPERSLLLAEKGSSDNFVTATDGFQFFATMNPGGDYGKKELSPALRNRFTEIWVPSMEDFDDLYMIVSSMLIEQLKPLTQTIVSFSEWFARKFGAGNTNNGIISLRDVLGWVEFMNNASQSLEDINAILLNGAAMVFIDALGTNNTAYLAENEINLKSLKIECVKKLSFFIGHDLCVYYSQNTEICYKDSDLEVGLFKVPVICSDVSQNSFNWNTPTTSKNLMRVARALQLNKPILLEGSPGVGKTSLITSLAAVTGHKLTRINLSEQTDLIDLFGSDVPGKRVGEFVWRDAPFLRAMQKGEWVLLDEMNLASQSVLEGLNACLDHRGEAYIPELDKTFVRHSDFVVFAAQNPQYQGGGRKGLPKSFVNRFNVVYVSMLTSSDLQMIIDRSFPAIDSSISSKIIQVMSILDDQVCKKKLWGTLGSPWEFNLRDTLRWMNLLDSQHGLGNSDISDFIDVVVIQRFRSAQDRAQARSIIKEIFGDFKPSDPLFKLEREYIQINGELIKRNPSYTHPIGDNIFFLQCNIPFYETAVRCINNKWPLLLVGPSESGKSGIIRFLACTIGAEVTTFSMNSDIDSMDILGGYEQVDITRKISYVTNSLRSYLKKTLTANLAIHAQNESAVVTGLTLFNFISNTEVNKENFYIFVKKFENFLMHCQSNEKLSEITEKVKYLGSIIDVDMSVKFEWFDGTLVKAIEEGHWLVLDNANLCPASVLDRLNSLLETNGSLIMNECNQDDGQPRVLIPHENFRLFLTVNPKYGELSRAMRNRAVEVFVDDLNMRASVFDSFALGYNFNPTNAGENLSEISSRLKSLDLTGIQRQIPLRHYLPPNLSSVKNLGDIYDIATIDCQSPMQEALLGLLSFNELDKIKYWSGHLYSKDSSNKSDVEMGKLHEFLCETTVAGRIRELYSAVLEMSPSGNSANRLINDQTLIPPLNLYIMPNSSSHLPMIASAEPVYLLTCVSELLKSSLCIEEIEGKSRAGKMNELSYIELSAAVEMGRKIKSRPRIPIFSLLQRICEYVKSVVVNLELFTGAETYKLLTELLLIWSCALETSSCQDEAKLRSYKDILENWFSAAIKAGIEVQSFSEIYASFDSAVSLSRGKSVTQIWNSYRTEHPTTAESWKLWEDLSVLSTKFDSIVKLQFSESYNEVHELGKFFSLLFEDIICGNVKDFTKLTSKLELGIEDLEKISDKFLVRRQHFFIDEYDDLVRFWLNSEEESLEPISELNPMTTLSTVALAKLQGNRNSYPPVFDVLWRRNEDDVISYIGKLTTTSFIENVILKSSQMKTLPGSHIRQVLKDAKGLLKSALKFPGRILSNQVVLLSNKLRIWIEGIIQIHVQSQIQGFNNTELINVVMRESTEDFRKVFENYLIPALKYSTNQKLEDELGRGYVFFGIALILLFAPDLPFDPAIHDYVMYDIFTKHTQFAQKLKRSFASIRTVISGDRELCVEEMIDSSFQIQPPPKPKVYRPESTVDDLFEEWTAFIKSTINPDDLLDMIASSDSWDEICLNRTVMFQQNTTHFLERISNGFKYYADLNEIFAGYVLSIKLGFDLIKQKKVSEETVLKVSPLWPIDPLLLVDSKGITDIFREMTNLFKSSTIENVSVENILCFFLKIFKFHDKTDNLLTMFNETLQTLYYRFSLRRLQAENEKEENARTYKYQDSEEDYEKDFAEMFPDYEDILSLENEESSATKIDVDSISFLVAQAYIDVFSDNNAKYDVKEMINHGSSIFVLLLEKQNYFKSQNMDGKSLSVAVNVLEREISMFEMPMDAKDIAFYKGSSTQESQKAVIIIERLWHFVADLLSQWPEHATLIELNRICHEFLQYSAITPIAKQLQKIEQIYTFMTEWEKYASSKVSLKFHIKSVTDLIISWRKLELQTWNNLLNSEDEQQKEKVGKWWYHLFETLIVSSSLTDISKADGAFDNSLLSSLNLFLGKCSYGEFNSRLKLLKAFSRHLWFVGCSKKKVYSALQNVISFYEQFKPIIDEHIINGRKRIEKDISEVILLASWKDVNVDALKQSSRRSHANLFKQVRKYRSLLSETIFSAIESGLPLDHKVHMSILPSKKPINPNYEISSAKRLVQEISSWSSRPASLKNIDVIEAKMSDCVANISKMEIPNFTEVARDFANQAEILHKLTPKLYKKDDKNLAALKMQKNKALNDSLKELRRIGLKSNFREDIHKVQHSSTAILANMASFSDTTLKGCDAHFFRTIDLLPRLRGAVFTPSEDIPAASLERGMAIMENLVFSLVTIREPMYTLASCYSRFEELKNNMSEIATHNGELKFSSLNLSKVKLENILKWLPVLIDYACNTLQVACTGAELSETIGFLKNVSLNVHEFKDAIERKSAWDLSIENVFEAFKEYIMKLTEEFDARKTNLTFFVYDILLAWIKEQTFTSVCDGIEPSLEESKELEELEVTFRKLFTSVLLSFQKIMAEDLKLVSFEDDQWLSTASKGVSSTIKSLRAPTVLKNMESAMMLLKEKSFFERNATLGRALVTFTFPILNHYQDALYLVLEKSRVFYQNLAHGTWILTVLLHNLAKDGFCSPEAPSEEVDDKNLQEGTGLGDGHGAQNNTEDIEQDEDLTEDAQKPNDEDKGDDEDDKQGEDDAVEMEGDMAGALETASDQEGDENEDKDEEEELDEEIDDLDEDDPNAIDDKMWDGEPEEEGKEKNTDKDLENKSDEADVQAAENESNTNNGEKEAEDVDASNDQEDKDETNDDKSFSDSGDNDGDITDEDDNVGEQEDEVRKDENTSLDPEIPDVETMDLPEDMNLDSGSENEEDHDMSGSEEVNSNLEDSDEEMDENSQEAPRSDDEALDVEEEDMNSTEKEEGQENVDSTEQDEKPDDLSGVEENIEENEPSEDEELQANQANEEKSGEEAGEEHAEGLDGVEAEVGDDSIDQEAAVQQDSGNKGKGSDSKDSEEQQDIGSSGATSNEQQDHDENMNETSRNNAKETLKQLGDSLKEYHKRRQEILEASQDEKLDDAGAERPDEFEHIDGANTESETQALGTANQEQIQSIDEENAIEDEINNCKNDENDVDMLQDEISIENPELEEIQDQEDGADEEVQGMRKVGGYLEEKNDTEKALSQKENGSVSKFNDELDELMEMADAETLADYEIAEPPRSLEESRSLWNESELATAELSARLSEQLRLILEPTLATKLKGDYKTGKRLNMKRIIPYIASQFRKDKIWLKRTKPSKREYQIMIALDDSKSMSESKCVKLAFDSLCLVSKTLTQLESGGLSIVKFGEKIREVHRFDEQFSNESGAKAFQWFGFQETKTDVKMLVAESIKIFERARALSSGDQWQLQIVISDGVCEDHETVERLVRRARESKIMLVFVIIDGINSNESIMDMSQVNYVPDESGIPKLKINKYLDTFPFEFYVIVRDITELPEMLSLILRQFFSDIAAI